MFGLPRRARSTAHGRPLRVPAHRACATETSRPTTGRSRGALRTAARVGATTATLATVATAAAVVAGGDEVLDVRPATASFTVPATAAAARQDAVRTSRSADREHGLRRTAVADASQARAEATARAKAEAERRREAAEERRREAEAAERRAAAQRRAARMASRDPKTVARAMLAAKGWGSGQFSCLESLWEKESGWNPRAENPSSGAYGIPQSLPGRKMAGAGSDWRTNPATQIRWGLDYIEGRYGTPCGAWGHSQSHNWY